MEAVGTEGCHELVLSLPEFGGNGSEDENTGSYSLGCFMGYEEQTYTFLVEDGKLSFPSYNQAWKPAVSYASVLHC